MNNNKATIKKYAGAIVRGGIGNVPLVGPFAVELLNVTIPNQRQERIEKLLNLVASKVFDLDSRHLEEKFGSSDFIDIFEDVLYQSIRATSGERLEYLASVIDYGLRQEVIEHLKIKRILEIISEINDAEIVILQFYDERNKNQDFRKKHFDLFNMPKLSSDDSSEYMAMMENYKSHLINLGLIGKNRFPSNLRKYSEISVFSESNLLITKLGVMLLEKIGIQQDKQALTGEPINPVDAINSAYKELDQREKKIRKELEMETQRATKIIESGVRKFESAIRRIR